VACRYYSKYRKYNTQVRAFDWVAGVNLWTEEFEQNNVAPPTLRNDFSSRTIGVFGQGSFYLTDRVLLEGGLRGDETSDYGHFILPKLSFLYTLSPDTTVRVGGELGYKEPTLFTEEAEMRQYQGVLAFDQDALDAERSAGVNIDVNRLFELGNDLSLNINWLLFYTRVDDPLSLVEEGRDQFVYRQLVDYLDSRGTEINVAWRWEYIKLFLGYTDADVREHQDGLVSESPLIPQDRFNTVLVYEREDDLRIGLEAYYFSSQALNDGRMSRDYWIFGLMMEKVFSDDLSLYKNFKNFTDTRQTRYEQLFTGSLANPSFNDIYAPLDGFVINGGVKMRF
jgi:outer membrane receptor for ferrienterochelin and colicins